MIAPPRPAPPVWWPARFILMASPPAQALSLCPHAPQVYKYKDVHAGGQVRVEVYISYGGLLMLLAGDPKKLQDLEVDSNVYLLVRKV